MSTRLVVVLGFSEGRGNGLHPVCASRLARAEQLVRPDDVVLFTGWAGGRSAASEADLMARAWRSPIRARLVDRGARTTLGNVVSAARAARAHDADEVVAVTSGWHARRTSALLRAALLGTSIRARVVTCDDPPVPAHRLRELASWALVPLLAVVAARTR
jgi:uncharacterized SAM-binding protein YcdF (DUF218 family)